MQERYVQSYPQALIELLQVKGQVPFKLSPDVAATLDITQILAATKYRVTTATANVTAVNQQAFVIVPAGQTQIVHAVTAVLPGSTGDQLGLSITFSPASGSSIRVHEGRRVTIASTSNEAAIAIFQPNRPWIVNAGDRLSGNVDRFVLSGGTTRTMGLSVLSSPFGPGA